MSFLDRRDLHETLSALAGHVYSMGMGTYFIAEKIQYQNNLGNDYNDWKILDKIYFTINGDSPLEILLHLVEPDQVGTYHFYQISMAKDSINSSWKKISLSDYSDFLKNHAKKFP